MKPDQRFSALPQEFWSAVRFFSQECGYSERSKKGDESCIKIIDKEDIIKKSGQFDIDGERMLSQKYDGKNLGDLLTEYFDYRATILNNIAKPNLMNLENAKMLFEELKERCSVPLEQLIPMNKQKGEKKKPAYFTAMINFLIRENLFQRGENECNIDPRALAVVKDNSGIKYTFSRRFDGAYPKIINPKAVWEIKEYYHTTTFGSRVADGVYETQLDGYEIQECYKLFNYDIKHYIFVDAFYTWWTCGKSYLCRFVDMMNMGLVDEVICGKEIIDDIPRLVDSWIE